MAESSSLQSNDERQLLQAALEHPFEPTEVPLSFSTTSLSPPPPPSVPILDPPSDPTPSEAPPAEDDNWQTSYASQVSEWRAQSASARTKAELARAKWEAIRAGEQAERRALGQPLESWDSLGDHITASTAAATHAVSHSLSASVASLSSAEHVKHVESHEQALQGKTDGSPTQPWEHLSSSQESSYPSMSFPEASVPQSPSHQQALLASTSASAPPHARLHPKADQKPTNVPPSTLPSIMDNRVAPRTRLSLVLSSLSINLLLPFINGVMLGFGEIFAKDVIIGWFGWKTRHGSTAAGLGLRR
ncbi:hypothetical protein JVT61DRAFT_4551 [Boletus reticuloceps]|uniref:Uncharacterized protein n=1 Tax=Boletus reticuloceps TaxID=495285 RepID=A0A8I2YMV8_9AGAM|nr:hypothetical protein JVT61DRAFT_4551 [Boletus reticuloceps]